MRSLSDTISRLAAMRIPGAAGSAGQAGDRLADLAEFGANPGALRAWTYVPATLPDHAPLVVVLHGCTQTAAGYDAGAGWSQLADRYGFALLFPEQQRANNANLCFNWFSPDDNRRDRGEAMSIRRMVATLVERHAIDPARIFVTGLSAGGAMASVMLATYPEVFAGGAIVAGLPYGVASTVPQAFDRMRGHGAPDGAELAALVRRASDHRGPWPTISIWHGSGDATVSPSNAAAIIAQWRPLHEASAEPTRVDVVDGYPHRVWCDRTGRAVIEDYSITGMGHGTPLDTLGEDACGATGAYMLEVAISSTRHICRFWGLAEERATQPHATPVPDAARNELVPVGAVSDAPRRATRMSPVTAGTPSAVGVGKVIEDALRAAGLMR